MVVHRIDRKTGKLYPKRSKNEIKNNQNTTTVTTDVIAIEYLDLPLFRAPIPLDLNPLAGSLGSAIGYSLPLQLSQ